MRADVRLGSTHLFVLEQLRDGSLERGRLLHAAERREEGLGRVYLDCQAQLLEGLGIDLHPVAPPAWALDLGVI
jgi:hypothetical protein